MNIRKFIVFIAALLCSAAMFGQGLGASENLINWSQKVQKAEGDLILLTMSSLQQSSWMLKLKVEKSLENHTR